MAAPYTQPSWDHRSIYANVGSKVYPLNVQVIAQDGQSSASVNAGAAAYYRFFIPTATGSGTLRTTAGGTGPAVGACTSATATTFTVGEVRTLSTGNGAFACLGAGEYVVVLANTTAPPLRTDAVQNPSAPPVGVTVAVTGVTTPPVNRIPDTQPRLDVRLSLGGVASYLGATPDEGFEQTLRARERAELNLPGFAAPRFSRAGLQGAEAVGTLVVRTR